MQHLTLKATTTATDQELGQFEALASAWTADREQDTIAPTAFDRTIEAWQRSGKNLPLLFEHTSTVVGAIDPHSMYASEQGLVVAGSVDREGEEGQQVWRAIKSGVAGFSIGFMADSRPRKGGGRELYEVDLYEISFTTRPVHGATKVLGWKSRPPIRVATFET
ncbi:MAG: HK97 family phage prohead protease [Actinomycetota bacterium]